MARLPARFAFVLLALFLCGIAASPASAQRVYYVDETGAAANGGTSFSDALPLQEALSQAGSGDAIVIAEGVYVPGSNEGDSFTITGSQDGLKVYGGWAGTESFTGVSDVQSRLDSRDLSAHRTILSGDLSGDDADPDGDGVIADAADIAGTNSFHLLFLDGTTGGKITTGTVIDGVTITAGQADGDFPHSAGGGLFCDGEGDPTYECSPTLRNLVFVGNRARGGGGAMNINGTFGGAARPILKNVIFDNNSAGGGGAIRNDGISGTVSPLLINSVFVGNKAETGDGGAIQSRTADGTASLQIMSSTFVGNTASEGGAVSNSGTGVRGETTATLTLTNTILWGNTASSSGSEIHNYQDMVSAKTTATHTIIQGGKNGIAGNGTVEFLDENGTAVSFTNSTNLDYNPQFVDASTPAGADGTFATADDGLRPITASPAVNAGDNGALDLDSDGTREVTTDLLGGARVKNRNVSLGAYEVKDRVRTLYVDTDATGANDGSSWTDAYTDLQSALAVATGNDEIWIAEGTYVPGSTEGESFTITGAQDGLKIYGGFDGTETSRDQRDPTGHRTILSGDIDGDDDPFAPYTDSDADTSTPTQTDHINGANSDQVLYLDGDTGGTITTSTVVDGVTVTGGQTTFGGGLYCMGGECSPTLKNMIFAGNRANFGGAIYNDGHGSMSSPRIVNALFVGNSAENIGGAIVNDGYYLGMSSPVIVNSTFVNNAAGASGGAVYNEAEDGTSSPVIVNSTFVNNAAGTGGGAVSNGGKEGTSSPRIVNTILWGNTASSGGNQIGNYYATPTFSHSIVEGGANGVSGNSGSSTTFLDESGTAVSFANSTNLDQDPQFADAATPAGADGTFGTADDGLRLTPGSPAIARGTYAPFETGGAAENVTTDIAGRARRFGLSPDMGAYELHSITSTSADIADASGLLGYLDPSGFGGTVLLRDNAASNGGLQMERTNTEPSGTGLPSGVAPYTWTVASELDAQPTYDLILETDDVPGIEDFSSLMIYVSQDGGQTWDPVDIEGTIVGQEGRNLLAVEGLTGFSRFAIGSSGNPLPVELASFEGASTDEGVRLAWQTASETNNAGFEVQRREPSRWDGSMGTISAPRHASSEAAWQTVGSVGGSGTTTEAQSYRFTDADLPYAAEALTYRLKQVDTDGTVSYSEEITVDRSAVAQVELLGPAPNPARSEARVRFAVPEAVERAVTLRLYDLLGRQVRTVRAAAEAGRHEQRLDVSGLPSGVYFLRLRAGATVKTQRMTVVR